MLFWRKSTDRAILLISLQIVLTTGFFIPRYPGVLLHYGGWWIPIDFLALLAGTTLIFAYTFPDGRFIPGFTRWFALGWIALSLLPILFFSTFSPWSWWLSPLYTLIRSAFYCSLALALLYRYRRMSTPIQRQQIKWVVFASIIVVGEVSAASLSSMFLSYFPVPVLLIQFHQRVTWITYILPVLFPLSIGIALLRYRLWEIDHIINRTLVYGTLTVILTAIYIGMIVGLQALLGDFISKGNR